MRYRWILALFAVVAAATGPSLARGQGKTVSTEPPRAAAAPAPAPTGTVDPNEYRIGPGDVLQVSIWKNEAVSRTVPVRPNGKISLPLLNDVEAAEYTPMELRDVLVRKLTEYMPEPEVSVISATSRFGTSWSKKRLGCSGATGGAGRTTRQLDNKMTMPEGVVRHPVVREPKNFGPCGI